MSIKNLKNKLLTNGLIISAFLATNSFAADKGKGTEDVSSIINRVTEVGTSLMGLISMACYVGAAFFILKGIWEWYDLSRGGNQQVKPSGIVIKLLAGGALASAPYLLSAISAQLTGSDQLHEDKLKKPITDNTW